MPSSEQIQQTGIDIILILFLHSHLNRQADLSVLDWQLCSIHMGYNHIFGWRELISVCLHEPGGLGYKLIEPDILCNFQVLGTDPIVDWVREIADAVDGIELESLDEVL
jgi:hypothetical protein